MRPSPRGLILGLLVLSLAPTLAQAQIPLAPAPAGIRQKQRTALPNDFGPTCCSILQIPASAFQPIGPWGSWSNTGYFYASGFTTAIAPVELPSGTVIVYLDLYYDDADALGDEGANLYQYPGYGGAAGNLIASVISSGSSGYGYVFSTPFSHTVDNDPSSGGGQYSVVMTFLQSSGNLGFKGVDLWYYRQVSP